MLTIMLAGKRNGKNFFYSKTVDDLSDIHFSENGVTLESMMGLSEYEVPDEFQLTVIKKKNSNQTALDSQLEKML